VSARHHWTAEVTYDGKRPFLFHSASFDAVAETETEADAILQAQVSSAWAAISPHPAPRLLAIHKGRLELNEDDFARADERRLCG
jgi:hypothetical protein